MPPKIDPYASKLHKRIDAILFVFTVIVIVLLLRASAHGQTTYTWTGNSSSLWNDAGNWDSLPGYGILQFSGSNNTTNTNNLVSSEFQIKFNSASFFTLGGNAISFFDFGGQRSQIRNDGTGTGTVNFNV